MIKFFDTVNDKKLLTISKEGLSKNEVIETVSLLAYENNISVKSISVVK